MTSRKILVVDDSPTERFFIANLLTKKGYTVSTAENADDLVAKVKTDRPVLIIMDVVMPGTSGFSATRTLARDPLTQDVPVIICSSKATETDRVWGLRQGAREYVTKPVDPDELLVKVASLIS